MVSVLLQAHYFKAAAAAATTTSKTKNGPTALSKRPGSVTLNGHFLSAKAQLTNPLLMNSFWTSRDVANDFVEQNL